LIGLNTGNYQASPRSAGAEPGPACYDRGPWNAMTRFEPAAIVAGRIENLAVVEVLITLAEANVAIPHLRHHAR
jgi:N-methylhydantoinase A/oxoprolinase/acetone carboxylase beta subunit